MGPLGPFAGAIWPAGSRGEGHGAVGMLEAEVDKNQEHKMRISNSYFKRGSVPPRCTLGSAVFREFFLQNGSM